MALINAADGTIGSWTTLEALPAVSSTHAMNAWNGKLYITGGYDGGTRYATVWMTPINADGTIGTWNTLTPMPAARDYHAMSAWNGKLYVTGGQANDMAYQSTVWMAPINANGTIDAWSTLTSMPSARGGHGMGVWNGRLYTTGGYSSGTGIQSTVLDSSPLLYSSTGTYFSPLIDLGSTGNVQASWSADVPTGTGMQVLVAKATSTSESLSTWEAVTNGATVSNVRYLNYRISMEANALRQTSPKLFDITFAPPPLPSSPEAFLGTAESTSSIRWSWSNVANEDGYYLHDAAHVVKGSTGVNVISTVETGLSANTQYTRHVNAYNSNGSAESSDYSRYTWANAPAVSAFSNITPKSIRAVWTANGNPAGTQYQCENSTNNTTSEWTTASSWDSTGLSPNTNYTFRVKARNGDQVETSWVSLGSASTTNIWYVDNSVTGPGGGSQDDPFKTINSAEVAANSGEEIHVKQGTYLLTAPSTGTITLKDGVYLRGGYDSGWSQVIGPSKTIISGEASVRCMSGDGLSSLTTIENFTIKNGYVSGSNYGGGLYLTGSSPTIKNCAFSSNSGYLGGGIYNIYSSPSVTNCTFASNSGYGGGIYNDHSSPTITNCTFTLNSGYGGGGINNDNSSSPTITNCTFTLNSSNSGGGIRNGNSSSPTIRNSIIYANTVSQIYNESGCNPTITYSCIEGGYTGTGNIDADPLFVNPPTDLHLQVSPTPSPCINAGTGEASSVGLGGQQGYGTDPNGVTADTGRVDLGYHSSGYPIPSLFGTKVGSNEAWVWKNAATGEAIPSGTPHDWSWRTWESGSGRKVPQGTAATWEWGNE